MEFFIDKFVLAFYYLVFYVWLGIIMGKFGFWGSGFDRILKVVTVKIS